MKYVFVSYRREDSRDISEKISKALAKSVGKRVVFRDEDAIPPTIDFRKVIIRSIEKAGVVLVVIGPKWLTCVKDGRRRLDIPGDHVLDEIKNTILRDIPILPILVGGATMPEPDDLPGDLRDLAARNALSVRDGLHFEEDVKRVVSTIRNHLSASRKRALRAMAFGSAIAVASLVAGVGVGRIISAPTPRSYGDSDQERSPVRTSLEGPGYSYRHEIKDGNVTIYSGEKDDLEEHTDPIPITLGRRRVGSPEEKFHSLRIFGSNPLVNVDDFPELVRDLLPKHLIRMNYFKTKVGTKDVIFYMGTTVRATPQFNVPGDQQQHLVPAVEKVMVATTIDGVVRVETRSHFGTAADVIVTRTYSIPDANETSANLSIEFFAEEDIYLGERGSKTDMFRFLTLSSFYQNDKTYDANVILYQDRAGRLVHLPLNHARWNLNGPSEKNDVHLFKGIEEEFRSFGSRVELVNEPGSDHRPEPTPSVRVDVVDSGGLTLGIGGFLYKPKETNERTVDVWVEWLDVPPVIQAGTRKKVSFKVTASGPRKVEGQEPGLVTAPVLPRDSKSAD